MVSSSSFHGVVFKSLKKDYGDGFYFFFSFVLIIFFCSSFFFFTGFNWRLQRHAYEICRSSVHFYCGYLIFFWFLKLTGIVLYVLYKDLMVSLLDLIFQVCKCLKWRVQPQTYFLSSKKPSLEMLFLIFLHFICSSSFVHHFFSLQASTDAYKDMHPRFAVHLSIFFVDIYFSSYICQI